MSTLSPAGATGLSTSGSPATCRPEFYQHKIGAVRGFTRRYGCKILVWYQAFDQLDEARRRELQMKEWNRAWKLRVIEETNPEWRDLYPSLF